MEMATSGVVTWVHVDRVQLQADPAFAAEGVLLALIVGLIGGIFPAISAARTSIVARLYGSYLRTFDLAVRRRARNIKNMVAVASFLPLGRLIEGGTHALPAIFVRRRCGLLALPSVAASAVEDCLDNRTVRFGGEPWRPC
jgi:hypothetical protein